jgi:hypothetical protein
MKTSIRLALSALAVSGVTFAASGKPLPFLPPEPATPTLQAEPLLPPGMQAEAAKTAPIPDALSSLARQ